MRYPGPYLKGMELTRYAVLASHGTMSVLREGIPAWLSVIYDMI
jgi:hypothetical protein